MFVDPGQSHLLAHSDMSAPKLTCEERRSGRDQSDLQDSVSLAPVRFIVLHSEELLSPDKTA
jgi:hypothetical protein